MLALVIGRRMRRVIVLGTATAVAWGLSAVALCRYGRGRRADGRWDAIVVCGCRVRPDGTAGPALTRRTRLAVTLFEAGRAPRLVLTGGLGRYRPSEARAAADVATRLGVPEERMLLESGSHSTEDNARFAAALLGRDARVLVVTDAYHVFRAERVFRRYFAEAHGVGFVGTRAGRIEGALREVAAVLGYAVLGRLTTREHDEAPRRSVRSPTHVDA